MQVEGRGNPSRRARRSLVVIAAILCAGCIVALAGAASAEPSFSLQLSLASDRSGSVDLAGAEVAGSVFVFTADTSSGVSRVRFWLDDPGMSGSPRKTELGWPHDFNGSDKSSGLALPFDTTKLADGEHVITAAIDRSSGGTEVVAATFLVANGEEPPPPTSTSFSLQLSLASDRSGSVDLAGAEVAGSVFVFTADTSSGVSRVRFWLDDPGMSGSPRKTELGWPHDFNGSDKSSGLALPFDTTKLADGEHVITAAIDRSSGGTEVVAATFLVANTEAPPPPNEPAGPDQVHLAWTGEPSTTMAVVWHTRYSAAPSTMQYRSTGAETWLDATGVRRPSGTAGTLHEVSLTGLAPATTYEYRVNGDDATIWSDVQTTRTAPPPGPADFEAIYVADTGIAGRTDGLTTGTLQVVDEIARLDPLVVLAGGDYAYYNTETRFATLDAAIDAWFNQVQPIASRSPLMPTYGNHEVLLGEGYDSWAARFPTPAGFDERRYFSFDIGDVHFVSIFAVDETRPLPDSAVAWIRQDVAAARAAGQRWIIPYWHVSPFSDGRNHPSNLALRAQLGPLFEELGVKLAIASHDQAYERTFPLTDIGADDTPTSSSLSCYGPDEGVVFAKVSPGGKISNKNHDFSQFDTDPAPHWTAVRNNELHNFARIAVSASGVVRFEAFGVTGDGTPPVLVDRFELRTTSCPPALELDPQSLALAASEGETATGMLFVQTTNGAQAELSVSDDADWLTAAPSGAPMTLTLEADAGELLPGTYVAAVTVTAPGFEPATAQVVFTVAGEYQLVVSASSDRASPAVLDGRTLAGNAYIFTAPDSDVEEVVFWLDDPTMAGAPFKVESNGPFDFAGTASSGVAKPLDTRRRSNGVHVITAALELRTGATVIVESTFTISN